MGICIQCVDMDGGGTKNVTPVEWNLASGWVWVVFRRDLVIEKTHWHLQGVAADETLAVEMCLDETYLIGPLPLNSTLPHDKMEWIGAYFPLR